MKDQEVFPALLWGLGFEGAETLRPPPRQRFVSPTPRQCLATPRVVSSDVFFIEVVFFVVNWGFSRQTDKI